MDISVVIVSYNGKDLLSRCLQSLFISTGGLQCEVFVVDNASDDGTCELVRSSHSQVILIENRENVGFARANNQAITQCRGRYVLLLNPDAQIVAGTLRDLVAFMDGCPEAGVAGPRLLNRDGSLQWSIRNFPTKANQFFEALLLHKVIPRASRRLGEVVYDPATYSRAHECDWISGAALIVRREVFDQVGVLDERYFMYSEEKDFCLRVSRAGWKTYFAPVADVVHLRGDSLKHHQFLTQLKSRLLYFEKFHNGMDNVVFRLSLLISFVLRIVLWVVLSATGRGTGRGRLFNYMRGIPFLLTIHWKESLDDALTRRQ